MSSNVEKHGAGESSRPDKIIEVTASDEKANEDKKDPGVPREEWLREMRGWVMILATLAASVTYEAGLNPPGGVWGTDDRNNSRVAGNPVLHDTNLERYETFYYFNSTALVMSVVIIILLMTENFYRSEVKVAALEITVVLDMISLMGAYIAGSTRYLLSSIYLIVLCGTVFLYVIYMSKVLPNLAFHLLLNFPCLEAAAGKGWLPVSQNTLDNVELKRKQVKMSPLKNCFYCFPPRTEQNIGESKDDRQPN